MIHTIKLTLTAVLLATTTAPTVQTARETTDAPARRDVDLVICLDTSGSMRGLLDSARQSIWAIANDLALAKPAPNLRIALLTFGNDGHQSDNGWVRVDTGFTQDLDLVSEKLFALSTNGGTEYVGRVLQASLERLQWTTSHDALKLIVVAGNESADQDQLVKFRDQCRAAIGRGIMINSIYCGNPNDNIAPAWREVAKLADGHFHAINQNGTVALKSPFDQEISGLSTSLSATYIPIGAAGNRAWANQTVQDQNAAKTNSKAVTQRAQAKCTTNYVCAWDLLDSLKNKTLSLDKVKLEDLPENMRVMTLEQRKQYVTEMSGKRSKIQDKIKALHAKREVWKVAEIKRRKLDKGQDFESAVQTAVRAQAAAKGLQFPKPHSEAAAKPTQQKPTQQKPSSPKQTKKTKKVLRLLKC